MHRRTGSIAAGAAFAAAVCLLAQNAKRIPAFPGAEGAGMYATGGRGGAVYQVTNLDLTGPGSIGDAVSRPNRIVVFTISGAIDLKGKNLSIAHPNLTIAGQTAPGEGICFRNGGLRVIAGNIVLRHLRIHRGQIHKGNSGDALGIKGQFEHVMADHISALWATDENLTLTNANNVTAQYSIAALGLDYYNPQQSPWRHSEGSLFGTQTPGGHMTIHHTLYAHNRLRNPRTTGHDGAGAPPVLQLYNSTVYDAKEYTSHTGSQGVTANWVNNYYKDGPSTGIEGADIHHVIFTFMTDEPCRLFLDGNYVEGSPERTKNNWLAVRYQHKAGNKKEKDVRAAELFAGPPVTIQSALAAHETVLAEAGAILPARDALDRRVVQDVRDGTGAVINTEQDLPAALRSQTYHSLPAPPDSDRDGIPDYWEAQFGLNPHSAADAMQDSDGDGYTNLEEYIDNTDPKGGRTPIVYVSASGSRAHRQDAGQGEFTIWRSGPADAALAVRYTVGGDAASNTDYRPLSGTVTIPVGALSVPIALRPIQTTQARGEKLVVLTVAPDAAYHIGCPLAALVAIEDGAAPRAVKLADIARDGGPTAADIAEGDKQMEDHKVFKKDKLKKRGRSQ